jgi:hypothetical protein
MMRGVSTRTRMRYDEVEDAGTPKKKNPVSSYPWQLLVKCGRDMRKREYSIVALSRANVRAERNVSNPRVHLEERKSAAYEVRHENGHRRNCGMDLR